MSRICPAVCRKSAVCFQMTACSTAVRMEKINLSEVALYTIFGLDHGEKQLKPYFGSVEKRIYEDSLWVDRPEPLLDYILSCHGNQNEYLYPRQREFKEFLEKKIQKHGGIAITKEAGVFICRK